MTMRLIKVNWNPSDRQFRQFGLIALAVLPLSGWLLSGGSWTAVSITAAVGAMLAAAGWIRPRTIRPVYLGMTLAALPIGIVIGEVALAAVFYGLVVPIGLCAKLFGRDALNRRFDRRAKTYWEPKKEPSEAASYLRQW